jgi:hypothetical protein
MKKKNEENLPEQGCGDKVAVEKETTNEVVENETANEEAAEEQQEEEGDSSEDDEGGCVDIHASGNDFLMFLSKLLRMMKSIVVLEKRLREFEKDPTFDMLMDLCMAHLQKTKESDDEKEPSGDECDDDEDESDDEVKKDNSHDADETVTEAFISMKVKKVRP